MISHKKLINLLVIALLGLVFLLIFVAKRNSIHDGSLSPQADKIRGEILAYVRVGDAEERVKSFFTSKNWNCSYDPIMRGYDYEVKVGSYFLEKHIVLIHFSITGGAVADIKISDFYRTL